MSQTKFCHYTTIENARNILNGGCFFMSEMSLMNDKAEAERHKKEAATMFVNCFSNSEAMSIPMFYLYGGIDGKGCRVEFTEKRLKKILDECIVYPVNDQNRMLSHPFSKDDYEIFTDWIYYMTDSGYFSYKGVSQKPYESYEETMEVIERNNRDGFVKDYIWRHENEYRFMVKFKNPIKYKRVAIKFNLREKERGISMMCGPETEEDELLKIREEFREYGITSICRPNTMNVKMGLVERNKRLYK